MSNRQENYQKKNNYCGTFFNKLIGAVYNFCNNYEENTLPVILTFNLITKEYLMNPQLGLS